MQVRRSGCILDMQYVLVMDVHVFKKEFGSHLYQHFGGASNCSTSCVYEVVCTACIMHVRIVSICR